MINADKFAYESGTAGQTQRIGAPFRTGGAAGEKRKERHPLSRRLFKKQGEVPLIKLPI